MIRLVLSSLLLLTVLGLARFPARAGGDPGWLDPFLHAERADSNRIVGGRVAPPGSFPAAMQLELIQPDPGGGPGASHFACGASVIAPSWALTAAHCLSEKLPPHAALSPDHVVFRSASLALSEGGHAIAAKRIIVHESYTRDPVRNDIALVELATPAGVPAVSLPDGALGGQLLAPRRKGAVVVGWGNTRYVPGGAPIAVSARLLQVQIDLLDHATCQSGYPGFPDDGSQFCAGVVDRCPAEGACPDSCQGDSGGPLFVPDSIGLLQAGVVSYGEKCGMRGRPGVYTSVAHYAGWILSHVPEANIVPAVPAFMSVNNSLTAVSAPASIPEQPALRPAIALSLPGGARIHAGQTMTVTLVSNVPGRLLLLNETARGGGTMVVPNVLSRRQSASQRIIRAAARVMVPDPLLDGWDLVAIPPLGPQRLIAIVVPASGSPAQDLFDHAPAQSSIEDVRTWVAALTSQLRPGQVAVGEVNYEIVP